MWTHGFRFSFHSPARGPFHLSLTVLVRYRSLGSIQPCRMVPAASHGIPPVPRYSGYPLAPHACRVRGSHPLRPALPGRFPYARLSRSRVLQPRRRLDASGLGPSPFAHHYLGNHCCFLLLRVLRCFSSPGSPPFRDSPCGLGCPIRTSADRRPSAPPRGFSQLITSFVASESQGIPHTPLVTSFRALTRSYSRSCTLASSSQSCHRTSGPIPGPAADNRPQQAAPTWRLPDSNRRPPACKAGALAS